MPTLVGETLEWGGYQILFCSSLSSPTVNVYEHLHVLKAFCALSSNSHSAVRYYYPTCRRVGTIIQFTDEETELREA